MTDRFSRAELLFGADGMERLKNARAAVFGIGGVGGYAAEALVRSGLGAIDLFDSDKVSISNLNRQIIATDGTMGMYKTDAMRERALMINPEIKVTVNRCFYMPENADEYDLSVYDYIIDAVDTVTAKIELAVRADMAKIPLISCMGAGNKLDAWRFEVADIYETSVCPLARVMRYELKKRGVKKLKVVYSKEKPLKPNITAEEDERRPKAGSTAFVPAAAGIIAAGEAVKAIALGE